MQNIAPDRERIVDVLTAMKDAAKEKVWHWIDRDIGSTPHEFLQTHQETMAKYGHHLPDMEDIPKDVAFRLHQFSGEPTGTPFDSIVLESEKPLTAKQIAQQINKGGYNPTATEKDVREMFEYNRALMNAYGIPEKFHPYQVRGRGPNAKYSIHKDNDAIVESVDRNVSWEDFKDD